MPVLSKPLPSQEYLNECFDYNPDTGVLTWKKRPLSHFDRPRIGRTANTRFAGKEAGLITLDPSGNKRIIVSVGGARHRASRIIWVMYNGPIPDGHVVDHINGNPLDNSLRNIRLATHAQNNQNAARSKNNVSGFKGVRFWKKRNVWIARIMSQGKNIHLGSFMTRGEAAVAYAKAALRYHGSFSNIGIPLKLSNNGVRA